MALPGQADPVVIALLLSPAARVLAVVWGLLWGSFANVVIHRVPLGQSVVAPRSRCGNCKAMVAWYDNLPILSYLWLGGQCRHCKTKFGLRYLFVELLGGLLSLVAFTYSVTLPGLSGAALGYESLLAWLLWFLFAMALVVVTFIDLDYWIIPPRIVVPVMLLGWVAAFLHSETGGAIFGAWSGPSWQSALLASAVGAGIVILIRTLYLKFRGLEGIGLGDAYLLALIGAFLGLPGILWSIGAGAIQGLLVAVPMRWMGRSVATHDLHEIHGDDPQLGPPQEEAELMQTMVPFGPFLALAALEAFALPSWYQSWVQAIGLG